MLSQPIFPAGELYTALERRTIDALEWVGPSLDLRMGFHKIAPYYYTGWHEPGTELNFMINEKVWKELPADLQAILKSAMRTAAYDMFIQSYHASAENWEAMKSEFPDIQVKTFPQSVVDALQKANDELLEEKRASDPLAKEILDSQASYLKKVRVWSEISDNAYYNSLSK